MAVTTTWSILDMKRTASNGGVNTVYWECSAANDSGNETAVEAGKLRLNPDPSDPDFIAYDSLTEADVLGWVYKSLIEDDETADEAKARIEADRTAKVNAQITKNAEEANGMPW